MKKEKIKELKTKAEEEGKRKKARGWILALVIGGLVVLGLIFIPKELDNRRAGERIPVQGRTHIAVGSSGGNYNSNPPTSGSHWPQVASWGVHSRQLEDELVIHNLEHGGIWISYKDIDDETLKKLEALAKEHAEDVVLSPRPANDSKIALASWGRLDKLDGFDEQRIREFIRTNKNKSPEAGIR